MDLIAGLFTRFAKSGMPPPSPPIFLSRSARPPIPPLAPAPAPVAGSALTPGVLLVDTSFSALIFALVLARLDFKPGLPGSTSRPRSKAFAADLKSLIEYNAWLDNHK